MDGRIDGAGGRLKGVYRASAIKKGLFIAVAIALTAVSALVSVSMGAVDIPFGDTVKAFLHAILPSLFDGTDNYWYSDIIINSRLFCCYLSSSL